MGSSGFQTGVKRSGQGPGVTIGASQGLSGLGSRRPFPHSLTLERQLLNQVQPEARAELTLEQRRLRFGVSEAKGW